ncbi:glycoside hydrolase [Peziza echinospora]|nr:glycoside hydrolase [Peziza echinospora]
MAFYFRSSSSAAIGPAPPQIPWQNRPNANVPQNTFGIASETFPEPIRVFINAAYYPNWAVYKQGPPSSLNLGCLSHIFYAFVHVKPDGTLSLSDEYADTQIEVDGTQGCLRAFGKLKSQHKHLKVILSLGGGGAGGEHFATVAADQKSRQMLAYSAQQLVVEYGFDGIDIDWEHPQNPKEGADYISLLQEIRRYLPAPTYILTSAVPAGEWALQNIDMLAASQLLDLINIMAYDFSGPWTKFSGHQAQLFSPPHPYSDEATHSGHRAVAYLEFKNIPREKLLLGIPVYGRSFLGATAPGHKPNGPGGEDGVFLYSELPRPGASPEIVDKTVVAASSVGGDGGFVTYDNPETVKIKANYVRERQLGGIFFWTGAGDVRSGERSLIETSYVVLHNQL